MSVYHFIIIAMMALACSKPKESPAVQNIGELRQIMHQDRIEARVNVDTLTEKGLYALGALDSLSGELMILDGRVYTSKVKNDSLVISEDPKEEATLLVYSKVATWDTLSISDIQDLEVYLNDNFSDHVPFPFLLIGQPSVEFHVINFDPVIGDISNHKEGAFRNTLAGEKLTILGFYATDAKGVYTHHDSNLHMHVINADETMMGHVDQLELENQMFQLLIPRL